MDRLDLTNELLDGIKEYMFAKKYPYNTLRTYGYTLKRIFKKHKYLDRDVINKLLGKYKHQNQRAVLLLIKKYCYDNHIDFNPVIPSLNKQKKNTTIKTLPLTEVEIMINSAPHPYNLMLECIFKIGGGLRISEAIRLCWGHFNWAIWLKDGGLGGVEIKDSKSDARYVTVPENLMKKLHDYARTKGILNEFQIPNGGIVFSFNMKYKGEFNVNMRENNMELWKLKYIEHSYNWFRHHILHKCCEKALGHKIRIHSLRHTRATYLVEEKKKPVEIVQKLLGHKDISTTMIYYQVSNKRMFEEMKDVD